MWEVLFLILILILLFVAGGTILLGRDQGGIVRYWSDIHVWLSAIVIAIAMLLRWADHLGVANFMLIVAGTAADQQIREIWLDCFFSGEQSD